MQALSTVPATAAYNGLDWFFLLILIFSTVLAFMRGLIRALFSLGGMVLGVIVAAWNYLTLARSLTGFIPSFTVAEIVAFLLILMLITILFSVIAGFLRKAVSVVGLGFLDRLLGAAFGLLRGCLLGAAILMAMLAFIPDAPWVKTSLLAPYLLGTAHTLAFVVPEQFQQEVGAGSVYLLRQAPDLFRPHPLTQPMPYPQP